MRNVLSCGFCALGDPVRVYVLLHLSKKYRPSEGMKPGFRLLIVGQRINAVMSRGIPANVSVRGLLLQMWANGEKTSGSER